MRHSSGFFPVLKAAAVKMPFQKIALVFSFFKNNAQHHIQRLIKISTSSVFFCIPDWRIQHLHYHGRFSDFWKIRIMKMTAHINVQFTTGI